MDFLEVVEQARALSECKGRVAYRTLRLQFQLIEEQLGGLKARLVDAKGVAVDEDGKILVWIGAASYLPGLGSGRARAQSERPQPDMRGTVCLAGAASCLIGPGPRERRAG